MKKRSLFLQILALMLCAVLLFPIAAFADGEDAEPQEGGESYAVADPEALQKIAEDYIAAHKLNKNLISIGYCYLDTGDTWFYNPDTWYYSASVYKVPLMMIYAEKEAAGELTQASDLKGVTLAQLEENVLVYDSLDYAHKAMDQLGKAKDVRKLYQAYAPLPEDYYDADFLDYSYFTARFTTEVMKTLYTENERFPQILECMKRAENGKYVHGALNGEFEVAQRSGHFTDKRNVKYNNVTAVVYTEHPFVLTIMTQNMGTDEAILRDLAALYAEYTLTLDEPYEAWAQARTEEPAEEPTEEPAEEPAEEPTEEPAEEPTEEPAEEPAAEPTEEPAEEPAEQPGVITPVEEPDEKPADTKAPAAAGENSSRLMVILGGAALLVILLLGLVVQLVMRRRDY